MYKQVSCNQVGQKDNVPNPGFSSSSSSLQWWCLPIAAPNVTYFITANLWIPLPYLSFIHTAITLQLCVIILTLTFIKSIIWHISFPVQAIQVTGTVDNWIRRKRLTGSRHEGFQSWNSVLKKKPICQRQTSFLHFFSYCYFKFVVLIESEVKTKPRDFSLTLWPKAKTFEFSE